MVLQLCDLSDLLFVIECVLGGGVFVRVQRSYSIDAFHALVHGGGSGRLKGQLHGASCT